VKLSKMKETVNSWGMKYSVQY